MLGLYLPWLLCCILYKFEHSLLAERRRLTEYNLCHMKPCLISLIWKCTFHLMAFANYPPPPAPELAIWKCFHMLKASLLILLKEEKRKMYFTDLLSYKHEATVWAHLAMAVSQSSLSTTLHPWDLTTVQDECGVVFAPQNKSKLLKKGNCDLYMVLKYLNTVKYNIRLWFLVDLDNLNNWILLLSDSVNLKAFISIATTMVWVSKTTCVDYSSSLLSALPNVSHSPF